MKNLKFAILFLSSFLMNTFAQANDSDIQELLDNPNIVWAAEMEIPVSLEGGYDGPNFTRFIQTEEFGSGNCTASVLKSTAKVHALTAFNNPESHIISNLIEGLEGGSLIARDDAGKQISQEKLEDYYGVLDTLVSFDPNTYEETIEVIPGIDNVEWFIAKILMYQDKRDGKLHTLLQSISPLFQTEFDKERKYLLKDYAKFTIDMKQDSDENLSIDNADIPWIKSIRSTRIDFNKAKILKGKTSDMAKQIFYDAPSKGRLPINISEDISMINVLEPSYVEEIRTEADTFITFTPGTYEETVEIVTNEKDFSSINRIHARMNWYWNEKTRKLECKLINVSPQYSIYDDLEKYLYDVTLFHLWFSEQ